MGRPDRRQNSCGAIGPPASKSCGAIPSAATRKSPQHAVTRTLRRSAGTLAGTAGSSRGLVTAGRLVAVICYAAYSLPAAPHARVVWARGPGHRRRLVRIEGAGRAGLPVDLRHVLHHFGLVLRTGARDADDRRRQLDGLATPATPRDSCCSTPRASAALWGGARVLRTVRGTGPSRRPLGAARCDDDSRSAASRWCTSRSTRASPRSRSDSHAGAAARDLAATLRDPLAELPRRRFGVVHSHRARALVGLTAIVAVLPLILVCYLAMRSWLGRVDDAAATSRRSTSCICRPSRRLSTAIEAKDGVTSDHIHRVQAYAMGLARALNVTDPPTCRRSRPRRCCTTRASWPFPSTSSTSRAS